MASRTWRMYQLWYEIYRVRQVSNMCKPICSKCKISDCEVIPYSNLCNEKKEEYSRIYNQAIDDMVEAIKKASVKLVTVEEPHMFYKGIGTRVVERIAERLKTV